MPIEKRQRSPSVPFIGLAKATMGARQLYERVGRAPVLPSEAAEIWGLAAKTGSAFRRIAALRGYGLIEKADDPDRIRMSHLAAILLETQEPEASQRAFAAGLRVAWRAGEQRPTHRRPYRRRKPIPRRASMLDDLRGQIGAWLAEEPGLPAIAILEGIKRLHPDRFTDKHARTVQRAVKQWRAEQAHRIITESAAAIAGAAVRPAA